MWTLENIAGTTSTIKSLADWGIDDLRISRANLDAQVVTLLTNGADFDAAEIFPRGSTVIVRKDNTPWFYGRVDRWSRSGAGGAEGQTAQIVNPWWHLAKKTFQQTYKSYVRLEVVAGVPTPVYEDKPTARLFLNLEVDDFLTPTGNLRSVRDQVIEILQFAMAEGAPIAIGDIDGADVFPEVEEVKMITCAEALTKQWRWARDMVLWWDYTTAPYPTVHFRKADNLPAVNIDLNAGTLLENFQIEELDKTPYVRIAFENASDTNLVIAEDHWPDPLPAEKFGGLDLVLDVRGPVVNRTSATLLTEPVSVTSKAWWKEKVKWLADPNITDFTFVDKDGTPADPTIEATDAGETYNPALTNELLPGGGSLPDWLAGKTGQSVAAKGWVKVAQKDFSQPTRVPIHYEMTVTNATSGTYFNNQLVQAGDPIPANLARLVWESHQRLGAQGSFANVEPELTGGVKLGNVVNSSRLPSRVGQPCAPLSSVWMKPW